MESSARPGGEPPKGTPNPSPEPAAKTPEAAPAAASGFHAWLPLVAAVVLMPVLAYAMTTFVLVPKLTKAMGRQSGEVAPAAGEKGGKKGAAESGKAAAKKILVPLKKVLVNVAGTQGMHFLMANLTLVGTDEEFKTKVEENQDQLTDLASSTLATKTISDLEKPGARNLIRTELISVFNTALGNTPVQELYFTEFAIQ